MDRWIEHWAGIAPDKTAIHFEGADISYRSLDRRIAAASAVLAGEFGVSKGDRIAFLGYNNPDFLVLIFACARLGAVMVPLNWRLAPPELLYILGHAGVSVLFAEGDFSAQVAAMREDLRACRVVGMEDFDGLLERAGDAPMSRGDTNLPILLVYTSGTTGRPKGAVLTQDAITWNALNSIDAHGMTGDDVVLTCLPMFHVGGLNIQTTPALSVGATVILHRRFDPEATVATLREERPSLCVLVPATIQAVVDHPDWDVLDLSCLRCLDTGSTTVPPSLLRMWLDRGVPVIQVYGATETAPIAIHQRIADAYDTAGSTGTAALNCEARIVDAEGRELGPGEVGEIVVRGPSVMTGYWNDPEGTAEALRDGWFHSGDAGHRDAGGNFYVDDRIKDVIISGSENIYPAELERVLDACQDIAEAAVVGRPDTRWGEVPVAVVVPRPGAELSAAAVLALFDGALARFKHPRDVVFTDALPRNVMGKVLKFELREMMDALSGEGRN